MSHLAMYAAPFDENNDNPSSKNHIQMKKNRKKTIKKRSSNGSKLRNHVASMIKAIHNKTEDNDDSSGLADFKPPPMTESMGVQRTMDRESKPSSNNVNIISSYEQNDDESVSNETFAQMDTMGNYAKEYYKQYVPYYNKMSETFQTDSRDEMLLKLNKIISLLEEQQDQRTEHVTEELILYCFLGVFVIFVVDSFARVGKYVR